jgi:hypothetical protein
VVNGEKQVKVKESPLTIRDLPFGNFKVNTCSRLTSILNTIKRLPQTDGSLFSNYEKTINDWNPGALPAYCQLQVATGKGIYAASRRRAGIPRGGGLWKIHQGRAWR